MTKRIAKEKFMSSWALAVQRSRELIQGPLRHRFGASGSGGPGAAGIVYDGDMDKLRDHYKEHKQTYEAEAAKMRNDAKELEIKLKPKP